MYDAELKMNDYKLIRTGPEHLTWHRRLKAVDTVNIHTQDKKFIFEKIKEIKKLGKKCVVMTHHAPSFKSIVEKYKGSNLSGAYATECFEDIWETEPDIWVHGHIHDSVEYTINKTKVFCNPRGYAGDENPEYNPNLIIEI
jgi:Icc-related predicted phosphoesterase